MAVSMEQVKELRARTGAAIIDCKKVLEQADGNVDQALRLLRERGLQVAAKKQTREAREGRVETYVHPGNKVVAIVELNCETDFVAKTEQFERLAKDIAMHISFADPSWSTRDEVPQNVLDEESSIYAKQAKDSGKPEQVIEKIVAGKLEAFYKDNVLMDQEWIQDKTKTIQLLIDEAKSSMGENVSIGRFMRIRVGEGKND